MSYSGSEERVRQAVPGNSVRYLRTESSSVTTSWGVKCSETLTARDIMKNFLDAHRECIGDLRARQVNSSFDLPAEDLDFRHGAYWSMSTNIDKYKLPSDKHLPCQYENTLALAKVATIIQKMDDNLQERLINWGYAVTDAAMRKYVEKDLPRANGFPYPEARV